MPLLKMHCSHLLQNLQFLKIQIIKHFYFKQKRKRKNKHLLCKYFEIWLLLLQSHNINVVLIEGKPLTIIKTNPEEIFPISRKISNIFF